MARERDHFATARSQLAAYTAAGRFGWGRPLTATNLAEEMGLSATPVREALAHLAGEGVIERDPGRGYIAPRPTSSDIAELYAVHEMFVLNALGQAVAAVSAAQPPDDAPDFDPLEAVFARWVGEAGNVAMAREHGRIAVMLRPVRKVETVVAPVPEPLRDRLLAMGSDEDRAALAAIAIEYHRDRTAHAIDVYAAMRRAA